MTESPPPRILPDTHLEVANRYQEQYEAMLRRDGGRVWTPSEITQKQIMVQNSTLLAIAGFLQEMPVCGHGHRGFCMSCLMMYKSQGMI